MKGLTSVKKFRTVDFNDPLVSQILNMEQNKFDNLSTEELKILGNVGMNAFLYRIEMEEIVEAQYQTKEQARQDELNKSNNDVGSMEGLDCPKCKNKGHIFYYQNSVEGKCYLKSKDCECLELRKLKIKLDSTGMTELFGKYSLDKFRVVYDWQISIKKIATDYCSTNEGKWLMACGQSGSGKSHICTAVVKELIMRYGFTTKYFMWKDEVGRILPMQYPKHEEYGKILFELKTVKLLYIDDFLQGQTSEREQDLAFEIINARCQNSKLVTIISTELLTLQERSSALMGRIKERCGKNLITIKSDPQKNLRLNLNF